MSEFVDFISIFDINIEKESKQEYICFISNISCFPEGNFDVDLMLKFWCSMSKFQWFLLDIDKTLKNQHQNFDVDSTGVRYQDIFPTYHVMHRVLIPYKGSAVIKQHLSCYSNLKLYSLITSYGKLFHRGWMDYGWNSHFSFKYMTHK